MSESKDRVYVRQLLSPQNVNLHGSVFGGDLYSLFDCAAYIASKEIYPDHEFVTRSTESAFLAPLYPGDVVTIKGSLEHKPDSSAVKVNLVGEVERLGRYEDKHHAPKDSVVARMSFVMVAVKREKGEFVKSPIP
ncbi:MAG: hypothetical protein JNM63_01695 [Spirochaetia bacterium]|nr:hypothetical protein [Spirochaetia bacterium]